MTGGYVAMLVSTYSNYYNQNIPGTFATRELATVAGSKARTALIASGVHDTPEECSYGLNWL